MRCRFPLLLLILLLQIVLFNCASAKSLSLHDRTVVFTEPYDDVFNAVHKSVEALGYDTCQLDRDNGIIETTDKDELSWEIVFGTFHWSKIGVNLTRLADERTRVVITITREERRKDDEDLLIIRSETVPGERYSGLFAEIRSQLGKKNSAR